MIIPKVNTYFSGAGLMDLGLEIGGLELQQSFEIDAKCCETQRMNFSHEVIQCDISQKLVKKQKPADVYSATYPCTKYSTVADINGTRTGDELYLHFMRHLAIDKPEAYVLENVPGMKKFPIVMEAMTKLPDYYVHVVCPVQSSTWLPQRRDRLIILGSKKPFSWRPPTASRKVRLKEIVESNPAMEIPDYVLARMRGEYRDLPIVSDPDKDDIAPTCVAHYSKDIGTRMVVDKKAKHGVRPYTVREYARLQGLPDSFKFSGTDRDAYKMIGNGVSVPVGQWIAQELIRYFNS